MDRAGRGAETQNKIIVVILDLFKIIKYHCHRFILVFVILVFFVIVMQWTLGRAGQWVVPKHPSGGSAGTELYVGNKKTQSITKQIPCK